VIRSLHARNVFAGTSTESKSALLDVDKVALGYGRIPVVKEVSLKVNAGEVVALLGANGAGKTTTLLGILGELDPLGGTISYLGSIERSPLYARARRGIAYVSEERSVIFSLTTLDNLRLGRGPVERALEIAPELKRLLHRRAGLLSGGEQQILTVARALASEPKVLLADELSLGLAPKVVDRLLGTVKDAAERGVGVLLVEQHVRSALAIADRAYVLRRGRMVMEGPTAELRSRIAEVQANYLASETD
jgi:branched-chain amino acid transport system ATP-binding protein